MTDLVIGPGSILTTGGQVIGEMVDPTFAVVHDLSLMYPGLEESLQSAMTDAFLRLNEAMREYSMRMGISAAAFRSLMYEFHWKRRMEEYWSTARTRPDGRPRRSGHRHRGTDAWRRRGGR